MAARMRNIFFENGLTAFVFNNQLGVFAIGLISFMESLLQIPS